jgi:hypothetical protein
MGTIKKKCSIHSSTKVPQCCLAEKGQLAHGLPRFVGDDTACPDLSGIGRIGKIKFMSYKSFLK